MSAATATATTATATTFSAASSRPVRAAKTAALKAIHAMYQSTRTHLEPAVMEEPVAAIAAVAQPIVAVPNGPYRRAIKREYFFPRPAEFTTSSEFTKHLKQIQPFGRRLFENIDWWNVEAPSQWNNGAITLQGTWWLESDHMEEYSWTIEIRPSHQEYRILLIANLHTNDKNEFYRVFWRQMSEEYIPRLHEFITKMTNALRNFL